MSGKAGKEEVSSTLPRIPVTKAPLVDRLLILGPPGVGKTEVIKARARELALRRGRTFVDLREASAEVIEDIAQNPQRYFLFLRVIAPHVFPEDIALPQPHPHANYVVPRPLLFFYLFTLEGVEGVLFIDELNNVQRDDQLSMYFSLILEKELAYNVRLSPGVLVVAAGNTGEWSEVARALPLPLINRLTVLYVTAPTVEEWERYTLEKAFSEGRALDARVIAFLKVSKKPLIEPPPPGVENVNFPTPRGWTELAFLLPQLPEELWEAACVGRLGPQAGRELYAFLAAVVDETMLDALARDPATFTTLSPGQQANAIFMLSRREVKELKVRYSKLVEYLAERHKEMAVLLVAMMDKAKRADFITQFLHAYKGVIDVIKKYHYGG
ncbi:MAG: AAA family ATPase [Thermofilum sp.]